MFCKINEIFNIKFCFVQVDRMGYYKFFQDYEENYC